MSPKLSYELLDQVAKLSYGDKKTLASASRVSRTWLTAFQKLLFGTIRIKTHVAEEFEEISISFRAQLQFVLL